MPFDCQADFRSDSHEWKRGDHEENCGGGQRFTVLQSGNEGTTKRTVVEGLEDLPPNAVAYKRLPVDESALWDKDSFPKGLRKKHNTRAGTWGKLVVERGKLMYQRLEPELAEFELDTTNYGVVQPQVYHQIKPLTDDLLFSLTFFRLPDEDSA
eukprot:CAMPEP_0203805180 /NCGR_PEP_ID=MMETSP0100_2-20121128/14067_1 /ASSEMBLY_ACC=CAM_ASM_000210 /TAXON_ID=96639 /ORGANISM=" , Strain NY0313808BC1" /LENGTH=153 /DNA_ID=CAMNT_0050713621 /DNA_START=302 /DNA_END=763 /DNA_ORIENTATION=-